MSGEAGDVEVEVEKPHAHHKVGHKHLDLILPIVAMFVSLVSIGIAYHHGHIMQELVAQNERLVQSNSLPYLDYRVRRSTRQTGLNQIIFVVTNGGVGPAKIETVEVAVAGKPVRGTRALLDAFGIPSGELSVAPLKHRMVRPGEAVEFFNLAADRTNAAAVDRMIDLAGKRQFQVRICYCSVFNECWSVDRQSQEPTPVRQCKAPPVPYEPLLLDDYSDTIGGK